MSEQAVGHSGANVRRIARSGGLNVLGAGFGAVTGFGLTLVLTNGLSQGAAGTVFATTSLFLIVTAVVQLGTESGMVRWLPVLVATGRTGRLGAVLRAGLLPTLAMSCLVAGAVVAAAPRVAGLIAGDGQLDVVTSQVRLLAFFLPLAACLNVVLAATRGLRTMRPTVLVESVGRSVLQLAAVAAVTLLGARADVVVLAWAGPYVFALLVAGVWLLALLRPLVRGDGAPPDDDDHDADHREDPPTADAGGPGRSVDAAGEPLGTWRQFWGYTGPRAVATIAQTVLKRADVVMVAALRSPEEAAVYAAASRFVTLGQVGVQALQQALSPQLSAMFARGDTEGAREVYQVTTLWAVVMAWPVYLACAVLAPVVLQVFGDGYTEGAPVVVLLALAMLVAVASGSVDTVILMSGRSWLSLANTLITLVINVSLNLLLIPPFGLVGAGIAWAVAIVVRNVLPLVQIRRSLGMSPFGPGTGTVAGAALLLVGAVPGAVAVAGAATPLVVLATALGGLAYLAVVLRMRRRLHLAELVGALRRRGGRGGPRDGARDSRTGDHAR